MAANSAVFSRRFLAALRTHTWRTNEIAGIPRVSTVLISNHGGSGDHTQLDRRPQTWDREGEGDRSQSSLLWSLSLGLGLCTSLALLDRREDGGPVFEPKSHGILERILPSAQCASPFKPDTPRHKYNFIADVVEKSTPAVVYIEIVGR